LTKNKKENLRK